MHDVVVVGAGPTGCFAARELARLGYGVLVLEEHAQIGEPVHCTGIISMEACRRFGVDPSCVELRLSSASFHSPAGHSFRVASDDPQAVVVDRSRFDQILGEQALSAGASFLLGARVQRVEIERDRVLTSGVCLGEPVTVRSSMLVVATGADDSVAAQLGLPCRRGSMISGAQLIAATGDLAEVEVHVGREVAPGGFAWAVPANGHGCRVGLLCHGNPRGPLERFSERLERRGAIRRTGAPARCRAVPSGPRTPSFSDRAVLIGDAAGQVKSTTSGGIYYGLLGAEAAVSAVDRALRTGNAGAHALSAYEQRWLGQIGSEQRVGRLLRGLQRSIADRETDALFWLAGHSGLASMLSKLRFDWHSAGVLGLLLGEMNRIGERQASAGSAH